MRASWEQLHSPKNVLGGLVLAGNHNNHENWVPSILSHNFCLYGCQFVRPKFKFLTYQPPLVSMINKYILWEVQARNEKKRWPTVQNSFCTVYLKHTLALNYESRQDKHVFIFLHFLRIFAKVFARIFLLKGRFIWDHS